MPVQRKSPDERQGRHKLVYDDIPIAWDGKIRGYPLPDGYQWCRRTRVWWETIRKSPQAMAFHETDWEVMLETALLHNLLWGSEVKPNEARGLANEIRVRCEPYGFTWASRRKFGIVITSPEEITTEAEQLTRRTVDYKARLNGLA